MAKLPLKEGYERHHILPCLKHYSKEYGNDIYKEFDERDCIYLTITEHKQLHQVGVKRSQNSCENMRDINTGRNRNGENNPFYGKFHSKETCSVIGYKNSLYERTQEQRDKTSKTMSDKVWINNGIDCIRIDKSELEKYSDWDLGRINFNPVTIKGKHWYNNGVESKLLDFCPVGWVKGRLKWM